jgi:hypothetical protein
LVEVYRVCRAFVESGVRPFAVVEPYPVIDDPLGLENVIDFVLKDFFLLQGSPQSRSIKLLSI